MANIIGIYCFTNKINNKKYIGQSNNVLKRYNQHKTGYCNKNHCCYDSYFYKALRKYSFENFEFTILEEIEENKLDEREIYWIDHYKTYINGYNMSTGGNRDFEKIQKGEQSSNAVLTNKEVYYIREQILLRRTSEEVYEEFKNKISIGGFRKIWNGERYPNVHTDVYEIKKGLLKNKLSDIDALEIRQKYMDGVTPSELVKEYSHIVKHWAIYRILSLDTWKQSHLIPHGYNYKNKK